MNDITEGFKLWDIQQQFSKILGWRASRSKDIRPSDIYQALKVASRLAVEAGSSAFLVELWHEQQQIIVNSNVYPEAELYISLETVIEALGGALEQESKSYHIIRTYELLKSFNKEPFLRYPTSLKHQLSSIQAKTYCGKASVTPITVVWL